MSLSRLDEVRERELRERRRTLAQGALILAGAVAAFAAVIASYR